MAVIAKNVCAMWADRHAVAALDTFMRQKRQFGLHFTTFRIVAPTAAQRTAFQKNGRPYPWAVMDCKTFNID
jgi:hypothetical protein